MLSINAAILLLFNISAYNFNEMDGTVPNVIKVGKYSNTNRDPPPHTEVQIPIKVEISGGTAIAAKGIQFGIYSNNHVLCVLQLHSTALCV